MKTGRNEPCPCGSGKKYKKCCLAEAFVPKGREDTIRKKLIDALMAFYENNYRNTIEDAHSMFWDEVNPQQDLDGSVFEFAFQNFFEWVVFDFIVDLDTNQTIIDLYLQQNSNLTQDQHKVLSMMKNSCLSLYEVQEVFPDKGLLLKDLLMGGEFDVKEKMASRSLKKWDIFGARLLLIDGQYILSGAVYPYSIGMKQKIVDNINDEYNAYIGAFPDGTMDQFLKENGDLFNFYWYSPLLAPPASYNLQTTSGEPMVFSKAIFKIMDENAVRAGLPEIKGFEQKQGEDAYTWFDKKNKHGDAIVLGSVEIQQDQLILECPSKERLARGKKLILHALKDAVSHREDTYQDPETAIKAHGKQAPAPLNDEIPFELQQQFYKHYMDNHYEQWFKDKIPALGNKTPLQAIKTEEGKLKVIELLKLYENVEEQNKQASTPSYDLGWVWEKLGLERE